MIESLTKGGYFVKVFDTKESAAKYLNEQIDGTTVGFGGSISLKEMGLYESLGTHNDVFSHWYPGGDKTQDDIRHMAMETETYISSVNGIAETGEIVNIDGSGNRLAGISFGHNRVFFVIGQNKVEPTYEKAIWRARNVAAPKNAARLNVNTPCVKSGRCHDCQSSERICKGLSVLWQAMMSSRMEVVLVREDLGY